MQIFNETIELADGRKITIETGKLAKQADGSVVLTMGKTILLATVVSAKEAKDDVDFMPLSCDYREKYAALGRFPGGFFKRETRPSNYEILISRLVDRALRPLFPDDYHAETFVNVELISGENETMPDALAGFAASAALMVSDIPFKGPVSEVRVAKINGTLKINPNIPELEKADLDLIVGGTEKNISMVEGEMKEVSENDMIEALKFAHEAIKIQCKAQKRLEEASGKTKKRTYNHEVNDEALREKVFTETYDKVLEVARLHIADKHKRAEHFEKIKTDFIEKLKESFTEDETVNEKLVDKYFHDVHKKAVREMILKEGVRLDGRKLNEIRPIWAEVDVLPSAHGSSIFTRGETQSLSTVTLGTKLDAQEIDGALLQSSERFILHYNFPPFSTGDARPYRGTGRREIGHGHLATRALQHVIPSDETINPYTIRIVSDILESNGSSSMATVCAGTLALMDAGVKISKPVSGIAMGLITDNETGQYAVLSDILGDEDHLGDMDFKVTGTKDGITATQMDIKIDGLSYEILSKALMQAKEGRLHILNKMLETISEPRPQYKPHTPKIIRFEVSKDFIGSIIGPGGKIIQGLQKETETTIVIEEVNNVGIVEISGTNQEKLDNAYKRIQEIVAIPEENKIYEGKIKTIQSYGAFVEIMPGITGLLHISEIEWRHIDNIEEILKVGDTVKVKLVKIEPNGKLRLSRKVLIEKPVN